MTTLRHELETMISAYLRGQRDLGDLRAWLLDHTQAVLDTPDLRLDELDGTLWRLISEYDRRDRDEVSVRDALIAMFPTLLTTAPARSRPSRTSPPAASRTNSGGAPSSAT
jgi:hypothetical protein